MREFMVHNSMTLAIKIRLYTLIMMILISPTSLVMDIEIYNSLLWQFTSKHGREPMPAYNLWNLANNKWRFWSTLKTRIHDSHMSSLASSPSLTSLQSNTHRRGGYLTFSNLHRKAFISKTLQCLEVSTNYSSFQKLSSKYSTCAKFELHLQHA